MSRASFRAARRPRRADRPAPKRPARSGFGLWLVLIAGGGFAGTFAALQVGPEIPKSVAGLPTIETSGASRADTLSARFGPCHSGGGRNCVVDGDTFWFAGEKYRIADIDAPETHPARCAQEAALGEAATRRLRDWLNAGTFTLELAGRDTDQYDRKLRIVTRGGASVGDALVDEGLARRWEGYRRPWCQSSGAGGSSSRSGLFGPAS